MASWQTPKTDYTASTCLSAIDLSRVESNTWILAEALGVHVSPKSWSDYDIPRQGDMNRIAEQLREVIAASPQISDMPDVPVAPYYQFYKFNDIESILRILWVNLQKATDALPHVGEISAGEWGLL